MCPPATKPDSEPLDPGLGTGGLQAFLTQHNIAGDIHILDAPTPTVETAAQALACQPQQIVKSILFLINSEPVMAVTCGLPRVDSRTIARHFEVGRKRVKLAKAAIVLQYTGYIVGAVPPFGYPQPLHTLLDPSVLTHNIVWAGGGGKSAMLRIQPQIIQHTAQAEILDLHNLPDTTP